MRDQNQILSKVLGLFSLATATISGVIALNVLALLAHFYNWQRHDPSVHVSAVSLTLLAVMTVFFVFSLFIYRDLAKSRAGK